MGTAERKNPISDTNRQKVGAYNVKVKIVDINGNIQEINAIRWLHNGDYLALSIADDNLMLVCLRNVYSFNVFPQDLEPKIVA